MPVSDEPLVAISDEVGVALAQGQAIVALESTLITHGLPYPSNLEAARAAEAAIRSAGAVPATVAIADGAVRVGLSAEDLEAVAAAVDPWKVSRQNLAAALARKGWSGTTVSATMIAARLAGIRVFATGGIGGVHRGGQDSFDISADLEELTRTAVAVVCAGPKSILDVPRTMEVLETRGVPVVGWMTDELPGFFTVRSGLRVGSRVDSAAEAAALVERHWRLGLGSSVLFVVPLPVGAALPDEEAQQAIVRASAEVESTGITGPATTPSILARVAELTDGRSVLANLALIENNARVAAEIANALLRQGLR
jgi:pseudouridylate synthase